jgi:polysaccharide pyruvyl transferase WcaK-like protein
MKILHLASFTGNIGDNFNHLGFRSWFTKTTKIQPSWENLEIRDFYWKKKSYDHDFANYVNQFDLFVIGGGNYFEFWVETSPTGTSISIPTEVFQRIKIPIYFNSLGVDRHLGYSDSTFLKFNNFLKIINNNNKYLVTVRNDGAMETLQLLFDKSLFNNIYKVPDPAFYIDNTNKKQHSYFFENQGLKILGINLASDMPDLRFCNFENNIDDFAKEFADSLNFLMKNDESLFLVFIPHIFKDLEIISKVISYINDDFRRKRIYVSEYGSGEEHSKNIYTLYEKCNLILGMRFHSNVIGLNLNKPTLGLFNYPQIHALYKDLEIDNFCIDLNSPNFSDKLISQVEYFTKENFMYKENKSFKKINKLSEDAKELLIKWLKLNNFNI